MVSMAIVQLTDADADNLRRATLTTLVALAEQHGLPVPHTIQMFVLLGALRLHCDSARDVDRWAAVLGLEPSVAHGFEVHGERFVSHETFVTVVEGRHWLGWGSIKIVTPWWRSARPRPR